MTKSKALEAFLKELHGAYSDVNSNKFKDGGREFSVMILIPEGKINLSGFLKVWCLF